MKKIFILDITGRNAEQYNPALCGALARENKENNVTLLAPDIHGTPDCYHFKCLIRLVPDSMKVSTSRTKRALRAVESVLNYLYVITLVLFCRPNVLHTQWLVFVDYNGIERFFFGMMKLLCPHLKLFLTMHNILPHDMAKEKEEAYIERFRSFDRIFDGYLVHLESSKEEMAKMYDIVADKISVAYHGLYQPEGYVPSANVNLTGDKIHIIMYGTQTAYKGADLFVDAMSLLPESVRSKISSVIVGKTDTALYDSWHKKAADIGIEWINNYVSDEELYEKIGAADLILLPYRKISQSGVLLLAISYKKPILTSDLPSFRETLMGYPDDYFFKPNESTSLANMLERFVDGQIDKDKIERILDYLTEKYSWTNTAKCTMAAYEKCRI